MTESHDDVIRQPTGSGFEYTFRCALGQGVDNYAAAGKLHCDLMREFQTRTRDVVELAFTRSCAVLRTRHELSADEVARFKAFFHEFRQQAYEPQPAAPSPEAAKLNALADFLFAEFMADRLDSRVQERITPDAMGPLPDEDAAAMAIRLLRLALERGVFRPAVVSKETRIADIFCPLTGVWLPTPVSGPPVPRERLRDGSMHLPGEERERLRRQHGDETLAFVEAAARALDEERAAKIQAAISTPMTPKVRGEGRRQ